MNTQKLEEAEIGKINADTAKIQGETTSREANDRWNAASSSRVEALARMYDAIGKLVVTITEPIKAALAERFKR